MSNNFESEHAYWDFAKTVRSDRRFIFDGKAGNFLAAARKASKSRKYLLKSGCRLYRTQIGSVFAPWRGGKREVNAGIEEEHPLSEERMMPNPKYIKHGGRANPRGFACLYLADKAETALAEMRPWLAESLTLAIFQVTKNLKLVVCQAGVGDLGEILFGKKLSAEKLNQHVWNDISKAFARPVNREDQEIDYLPTQILAEAFKAEGFDGIIYRSGLD